MARVDRDCCEIANVSFSFKKTSAVIVTAELKSGEIVDVASFTESPWYYYQVDSIQLPPHTVKVNITLFAYVWKRLWIKTPTLRDVELGVCCPESGARAVHNHVSTLHTDATCFAKFQTIFAKTWR